MNLPRISIVTPTLNQGRYLEETIVSVLDQRYPRLEYIIIDGGSTDNTVEIIRKYAKHLAYWVSEPDRGQSHAINKGLEMAGGEVFNWLNSDDFLASGALHAIGEAFSDARTQVYCGRMRMFWEDSGREAVWTPTRVSASLCKMIGFSSNRQPATWFRLSGLRKTGALTESLHYTMDQDMWVRYLIRNGNRGVRRSDALLVHFRRHAASKTDSRHEQFQRDLFSIFHSFARINGLQSEAEELSALFGLSPVPDYTLDCAHSLPRFKAKRILHYYKLRMLELYLSRGDVSLSGKIHRAINPLYLLPGDWKYYFDLSRRTG